LNALGAALAGALAGAFAAMAQIDTGGLSAGWTGENRAGFWLAGHDQTGLAGDDHHGGLDTMDMGWSSTD
jgi:hypothetical protein